MTISRDRSAVHRADDWNRQGLQLCENALIEGEGFNQLPRVAFELLAELQQVAAGGKSSTVRGNDNCAQCPIGRELVQHAV